MLKESNRGTNEIPYLTRYIIKLFFIKVYLNEQWSGAVGVLLKSDGGKQIN